MRYSHDLPTFCFVAAHQVVCSGEGSLLGIANSCSHFHSSPCLLLGSHFWLWHIRYHSLIAAAGGLAPFMHLNAHCHCPYHVCHCDQEPPTPPFVLSMQLKHLHNVEKRLYCPQTFLCLDFQCRDDVYELNRRFGAEKSH